MQGNRSSASSGTCLIAACVQLLAAANAGAVVNFSLVAHSDDALFADLRTTVPSFGRFGFAAPALNSQGVVSFLAGSLDASNGDVGLFSGSGSGVPKLLLRTDGNGDDPGNPFDFIDASAVPISFTGDVAFGATLKGGGAGIFRFDAASGAPIALATDQFVQPGATFGPGAYDDLRLRPSMNDNGDVVFAGVHGNGGTAGVFSGADPLATRLIDTTQSTRQASFWLEPVITTGGVVGAMTENFDPGGPSFFNEIVAFDPGAPGERVLASTGDGSVDRLQPPSMDINVHRQAVFKGLLPGLAGSTLSQQLLVARGGLTVSVADASTGPAGAVPFRVFTDEAAITGNGVVAFAARTLFGQKQLLAHQLGRATTSQGKVYAEVLRTGMQLDGRTVDDFTFTREGINDRGEFAFVTRFTDGSSAVYKANFGSTAPGVLPQPGLRAEAETRRYDFATNQQTVTVDVDIDTAPGQALAALADDGRDIARADALNDTTGSHLKAMSTASSSFSSFREGKVTEARALSSVITNWVVPNPNPLSGVTQETIQMLVVTDGTLLHQLADVAPIAIVSSGRLSSPGGAIAYDAVGSIFPRVPLVAEVALTINANVAGSAFNAFGGYASLRNGQLIVAGDWDPAGWTLGGGSRELRADIDTFQLVEYTINYDETFALEFIIETFANSSSFFGVGSAVADFGNTTRFALTTRSGAPVVQLGSNGQAFVPLPGAAWLFGSAVLLLCARQRHRACVSAS